MNNEFLQTQIQLYVDSLLTYARNEHSANSDALWIASEAIRTKIITVMVNKYGFTSESANDRLDSMINTGSPFSAEDLLGVKPIKRFYEETTNKEGRDNPNDSKLDCNYAIAMYGDSDDLAITLCCSPDKEEVKGKWFLAVGETSNGVSQLIDSVVYVTRDMLNNGTFNLTELVLSLAIQRSKDKTVQSKIVIDSLENLPTNFEKKYLSFAKGYYGLVDSLDVESEDEYEKLEKLIDEFYTDINVELI